MLVLLLVMAAAAFAVPAKPGLTRLITLKDGTTVNATLVGDEHGHFWRGADGKSYQTIAGTDTYQEVNSQDIVQMAQIRRAQANQRRTKRLAPSKIGNVGSITGQKKGLIILVNFSDVTFKSSNNNALYQRIANEKNFTYTVNSNYSFKGSMYDYFKAQSEGKLELTFDVVGPVTVSNTQAYYGGNNSNGNDVHPAEMVIEAINLADELGVNYADYDWNGDNEVDQVYVVYAGNGEADSDVEDAIWPHEYDLYSANYYGDGAGRQKLDGVWINTYACGGELNGSGVIAGIGTMCHEFSHCLGYPDFYDTDYSGGQGMGYWDLMDSGSYNDNGYQPAGYTSYERWVAGWKTPTELVNTQTISNMKALQTSGSETYIIYNKGNNDEYYLLENRQKTGWDASLPGAGLLILHVDYSSSAWSNNTPNNEPSHQRMTWIAADNNYQYTTDNGTKRYTFSGMANDPFPYGSVKAFGKNTTPAATLYNQNSDNTYYLDSSVENITQNSDAGKTISFHFIGEGSVDLPTFSPDGGRFAMDQTVTVAINAEAGSTIYYTTNGSTPTTSSTQYTAPFTVNATTTVKAIAVKNGESSGVASATYTFVEPLILADENLSFSTDAGTPQTKTLTVLTEGLTQDITLTLTDANGVFSLGGTTISKDLEEATIEVTFAPTAAGTYTGSITLTSEGAETVTVQISGTATETQTTSDETIDFTAQGYSNEQAVTNVSGTNCTVTFNKGSNTNAPKYYTTGTAIRVYGGNTMTIASATKTIVKIEITFGSSDGSNAITTDVVTYDNGTWTGSASSVKFTVGGTSGNRRIQKVKVTYADGGTTPVTKQDVTMSFSPATATATMGESFTAPTLTTDPSGLTVTYSSSKTSVATVDENTGAVTLVAAGTTAITATFAGNDSYNEGSASYTLTVNEAQSSSGEEFALITKAADFVEGDYIIVYSNGAMNTTVSSNRLQYTAVTPTNDVITTDDATIIWHIAPSGNYYTIYNAGENKYAAATSSNNQAQLLTSGTDDKSLWSVPTGTTFDFQNKSNSRYLRRNGTYGFACYATGTGGALSLYKRTGEAPITVAAPTISGTTPFDGSTTVTITAETGASIYYTLDGTTPTASSTIYSAPFTLTATKTVKAVAVKNNISSSVTTKEFVRTPPYYEPADGKTGSALKTAMCGIIYNRRELDYDDLWTAYRTTDVRSDGTIWDMYSNITAYDPVNGSHTNSGEGSGFNREHSFPKSWFGGEVMPMFTDLHHLYPVDAYINGMRSNNPYGETNGGNYKSANDFSKLGTCTYPGYTGKVFEPADEYKGDFARTYFYMVTCYEEKLPDWYTNYSSTTEVGAVLDGSTYPGFQTWQLNMLMEWAKNDPVSEKETNRNNAVYAIQNNRNPFIDYPGLEEYIWGTMTTTAFSYDNYVQPVYKQDVTMSFSPASATATIGEAFTEPTLTTTPDDLAVTYNSSEPTVATVDESTGEVTLVAAGTTTITATFAGNDSYNSGTASYTLTVSAASIPEPAGDSDIYELVTDATTLTVGDKILIAYVNGDTKHVLSTTQNNNNRAATNDVTLNSDGTLTSGTNAQIITLEKDGGKFLFNVGNGYLYAASSGSNYLKTESTADDNAKATISISNGSATITFQGTNTRNTVRYNPNNGNPIFSCYVSTTTTGSAPQIYRMIPTITLANATSNSSTISTYNGKRVNATLADRTLYKDGAWNTLCLPFSMTATQVTAQLAPTELMELDTEGTYDTDKQTGLDGTTLYLYFKNATSIEAGKPYLIKWSSGNNIENPTFNGVTVSNASTEVTFTGGKFVGTYSPVGFTPNTRSILFLGTDNYLYWPNAANNTDGKYYVNAFRAYFDLGTNNAREFVLRFFDERNDDDDASGIKTANDTDSDSTWYDMSGRRLSGKPGMKGMYINNGKKVIIK